jgi:hypothetical protein
MLKYIFWSFLCCMKIQYDFFSFERLGRMQWNNVKTFFFWMGRIGPQWKPGRDWPKNEIELGPAQKPTFHKSGLCPAVRAGLSIPREQKAGYCAEHSNELIIFICCRTWIAHVLHANEDNREEGGQRKGEDYLEWGSVVVGLTVAAVGKPDGAAVCFFFSVQRHQSRCLLSSSSVCSSCLFLPSPHLSLLLVSVFLSAFYSLFISFSFFLLPFSPSVLPCFFSSLLFFCYFNLLDGIVCLSRNLSSLSISPPSL